MKCPTSPSDFLGKGGLRSAANLTGGAGEAKEGVGKWTRKACMKRQLQNRRTVLSIVEYGSKTGERAVEDNCQGKQTGKMSF